MHRAARFSVFFFFILFLVPFAKASVVITSPFRETYNLGYILDIEGYIIAQSDMDETFALSLVCDGVKESNFLSLELDKSQKVSFSIFDFEPFVLDTEGTCSVEVVYGSMTDASADFTVVDDLEIYAGVNKNEFRLGESLEIEGTVFRLDGSDVNDGTAKFYFRSSNNDAIILGEAAVENGSFEFVKKLDQLPSDRYYLEIEVTDSIGNNERLERAETIDITDEILFSVKSDNSKYNPGSTMRLEGKMAEEYDDLEILVTFADQEYTSTVDGDSFNISLPLSASLASDNYKVVIDIEDSHGNDGSHELTVYVNQVPTTLKNSLDQLELDPGDTLTGIVSLYDQAGKVMGGDVSLEIEDPTGSLVYEGTVEIGQKVTVTFSQYSKPGTYVFRSTLDELTTTTSFVVTTVSSSQSLYEDQTIYVLNDGNVDYNGTVEIVLVDPTSDDPQYIITHQVALSPGEKEGINLTEEVPPGSYQASINGMAIADPLKLNDDNRVFGKKLNQKVSAITGASSIDTSDVTEASGFLFIFFLLVAVGIVSMICYDQRERLGSFVSSLGKKEDNHYLSSVKHREPFQLAKKGEFTHSSMQSRSQPSSVSSLVLKKPSVGSSSSSSFGIQTPTLRPTSPSPSLSSSSQRTSSPSSKPSNEPLIDDEDFGISDRQ